MNKLVSVVITTYNQEEYIIECLDSIFNQTYEPIELIISDDASTDSTVDTTSEWLKENKSRFINSKIIANKVNSGISNNHTIGVKCASGEYVKYLGGDDLLLPNAIEECVNFCEDNNYNWIQCLIVPFSENDSIKVDQEQLPLNKEFQKFQKIASRQHKLFCKKNFLAAPGLFFKTEILKGINFFGTEIRSFEDWHTWIRLSKSGYAVRLLNKSLVYWRRHDKSVSFSIYEKVNKNWYSDLIRVIETVALPSLNKKNKILNKHLMILRDYCHNIIIDESEYINHKKSRMIFLKDPVWWLNLIPYLKDKIKFKYQNNNGVLR